MSAAWREEVRPCFCGKGRIIERWFRGRWSEIVLQCAACDQLYEFKAVERGEDGAEKTAWVKRTSKLRPDFRASRGNPFLISHDYAGFFQLALPNLRDFDSVGWLYVTKSESIPHFLKIGVTTRAPDRRAEEITKDFYLEHPFQVKAAWRMRNYLMVEDFILGRLMHRQYRYVKARVYFRDIKHRKLCVRTHRSCELYKCTFKEACSQISLILNKSPEVVDFEQSFLDDLTQQLNAFRTEESRKTEPISLWQRALDTGSFLDYLTEKQDFFHTEEAEKNEHISAWQRALDTVKRRLSAGETSMCVLETLHSKPSF